MSNRRRSATYSPTDAAWLEEIVERDIEDPGDCYRCCLKATSWRDGGHVVELTTELAASPNRVRRREYVVCGVCLANLQKPGGDL